MDASLSKIWMGMLAFMRAWARRRDETPAPDIRIGLRTKGGLQEEYISDDYIEGTMK